MHIRRTAVMALAAAGLAGCGARAPRALQPLAEVQGGSDIYFGRDTGAGFGWTQLKVRPPYATGPDSQMIIRRGKISGIQRGAGFSLETTSDSITGFGPGGPVEMEVWGDGIEMTAEGMWNGATGRFSVTPEGVTATLAERPSFVVRGQVIPAVYHSYAFGRGAGGVLVGSPERGGTSPATALEIAPDISRWLTRSELLAVLMTLLSRPPTPTAGLSPRGAGFEGPR
jgi:hypothetical protein